ncbi:hypothetical protein BDK92_2476 [Micromonospora pisi]|uniref:Excreted virulence factor EspC (Type VII ESX diderm) n=1 Tax=Micromonospora pisi TaxID=589240 RepID=A0A495JHX5_9ACTN|nr:hypothetical protein [Micromonospora pisi]RKR88168.1 hypothetical protein BDK92_2476 [Micromonospora pisi]
MADGLLVETETLRQAGQQLLQLAEELDGAWARFSGQVQAMGDIFGDDDVGGLIGIGYHAAHEIAGDSYLSVVDGLYSFSAGLSDMADNYDSVEADNTGLFSAIY